MRRYAVCLVLLLTVAATPLVAGTDVDINFFLGSKSLDQDDRGNADRQGELGVHTSFGPLRWPVRIALDAMGSADSDDTVILNPFPSVVDLTQSTAEFDVGAR